MRMLIKNGRVIDPASGTDDVKDVLIEQGVVTQIASVINSMAAVDTIDAAGLWVTPGLIDLHAHLRDPGFTHKETMATGTRSAAAGGYTTICAMPNTAPVTDNPDAAAQLCRKACDEGIVHVLPIGSITQGQQGKMLTDFAALKNACVFALSEDGKSVQDDALMALAVAKAAENGLPIFSHCENIALANGGVMHAGQVSAKLGLPGISRASEDDFIARDIALRDKSGGRLHICHVSTKGGVALIQSARRRTPLVTAEVCPHHFTLTDEAIDGTDANYKMNPPLRSAEDISALIAGLRDGTIGVIATDHAPHHADEKNVGFLNAPNGIVGFETAFAVAYTTLVAPGVLSPMALIEKMSLNPANVLGLHKGRLAVGAAADIAIFDTHTPYRINVDTFRSKSKNSPFHGMAVKGAAKVTIVSGRVVFDNR